MSDLIKTITVNGEAHELGADYNKLDNLPTIPADQSAAVVALQERCAALETALSALAPKKVTFTWDDSNITKVETYKYYSDTAHDDEPAEIKTNEAAYSRDGNFGYPTFETDGQVNFEVTLADDYDALNVVADSTKYNNFKTPYLTCVDNLYRFTQVASDFSAALTAGKESDFAGWTVTYTLVLPEGFDGTAPTVVVYRTDTALEADYKGETLTFTDGVCEKVAYSKETGYPDSTSIDVGNAQANYKVTDIPEGYTVSVAVSGKAKTDYNKSTFADGIGKITKVANNLTITLTMTANA